MQGHRQHHRGALGRQLAAQVLQHRVAAGERGVARADVPDPRHRAGIARARRRRRAAVVRGRLGADQVQGAQHGLDRGVLAEPGQVDGRPPGERLELAHLGDVDRGQLAPAARGVGVGDLP